MKILVVCQHYWPEPYPLASVCEQLVQRGHEVHVITGVPNYPAGYIYSDYRRGKQRREEHNGVRITRTFTISRRGNPVFRVLNYYSYCLSSLLFACNLREDYDVVFANQSSPVMMARAALAYGKRHGRKCVLYCMDLWPASLTAGGFRESGAVYRLYKGVSARIYQQADRVLISSRPFRDYLTEELGIKGEKIYYLPQAANELSGVTASSSGRKHTIDLVFAGNIGKAQSMETILEAATLLRDIECLQWHIIGAGSELEKTKRCANERGLDNMFFHGFMPEESLAEYYSMADAMLLTLMDDPVIARTLPRRMQAYMAAGKPVLAAAGESVRQVIWESQCGYCVPPGDSKGLVEAIRAFLAREDREQLGRNARAYYEENFSMEVFIQELEMHLYSCLPEEEAQLR